MNRVYILTKKGQPAYSHEIFLVLADGKKELEDIVRNDDTMGYYLKPSIPIHKVFDIEEKSEKGVVYKDIY